MARRRSISSRKRKLEQGLKQGLAELKNTRQTLREAEKSVFKRRFIKSAEIPNTDFRKMLRLEKEFGVYNPKSGALTASRKRAIIKHWEQFEELQRNAVFAQYPTQSKKTRNKIVREVKKSYPKSDYKYQRTNKKGIWLPKTERQIVAPVGTLRYDRRTGVYGVEVSKKTRKGMVAKEFRYIASSDILEGMEKKLKQHFQDINGKLKKNQRIRFIIGQNKSRQVFRTMEQMFAYMDHYDKTPQGRATFLNELIIEVVTKGTPTETWRGKGKNRRLVKDPWTRHGNAFRVSNFHEVNVDDYLAAQEEIGEDDYEE